MDFCCLISYEVKIHHSSTKVKEKLMKIKVLFDKGPERKYYTKESNSFIFLISV